MVGVGCNDIHSFEWTKSVPLQFSCRLGMLGICCGEEY